MDNVDYPIGQGIDKAVAFAAMARAIDLPKPFLTGRAYRQWCFHAWVGQALLAAIRVMPAVETGERDMNNMSEG